MSARQTARAEAPRRDPVRDQARAEAVRALANHQGIIRSMSADQRRAVTAMDPGPSREVGLRSR